MNFSLNKKCNGLQRSIIALTIFSSVICADSIGVSAPKVFCDDAATLVASKAALVAGDASLNLAWQKLRKNADPKLNQRAASVMDKQHTAPSGDKHDFVSQAPYFWRDTNSPDGKYIRRDGAHNPEANQDSDSGHFQKTCADAHALALAFYFSGDEKYAAKATELIRVWFLNPATKMNPDLNFGQSIPGETEGRSAGLISARGLINLVDAIGLLANSKSWTAGDQKGMTAWFSDYLQWLTASKIGRGELIAKNNHGTWCNAQAAAIALFLGKTEMARDLVSQAREKIIAKQIEPDGRMPLEIARTTGFSYSLFNLRALMNFANIGNSIGVDLWHYKTKDGRSILKAAEFMAQFANPENKWPYQQIQPEDRNELAELLSRAAAEFPESKSLQDSLKFFNPKNLSENSARLYLKTATTN